MGSPPLQRRRYGAPSAACGALERGEAISKRTIVLHPKIEKTCPPTKSIDYCDDIFLRRRPEREAQRRELKCQH